MENVSVEQKLEVGKGVIKADTWLKQFSSEREELQQSSHGTVEILTNLKNYTVSEIIFSIALNVLSM